MVHVNIRLRFELSTVVNMKATVIWDVTPCSQVEVHKCFRRMCCLHHQSLAKLYFVPVWLACLPWRWRPYFTLKHLSDLCRSTQRSVPELWEPQNEIGDIIWVIFMLQIIKSLWCSFAAKRIRKARKRDLRSSRSRNQLLRNLRFRKIFCAACARTCLPTQSWSHAVGTLSVMNVSAVIMLKLFPNPCVQCVKGLPSYCCLPECYCIWHGTLIHSVLSLIPTHMSV